MHYHYKKIFMNLNHRLWLEKTAQGKYKPASASTIWSLDFCTKLVTCSLRKRSCIWLLLRSHLGLQLRYKEKMIAQERTDRPIIHACTDPDCFETLALKDLSLIPHHPTLSLDTVKYSLSGLLKTGKRTAINYWATLTSYYKLEHRSIAKTASAALRVAEKWNRFNSFTCRSLLRLFNIWTQVFCLKKTALNNSYPRLVKTAAKYSVPGYIK